MKEATGELNMTVVTVVAIAAIGAFFYAFVWPAIKTSIMNSTKCSSAVCSCTAAGRCTNCVAEDGATITCNVKSDAAANNGGNKTNP